MAGFELLAEIAKEKRDAIVEEVERVLDEERRERLPADLWRLLPDS